MAVHSFSFITLMVMSLCCVADGNLNVPDKVVVPIGRSTHVTCAYTENDAHNMCLSWNQPPSELVNYTEVYNTTGRFLTMEIQTSQEATEMLTCTALNTIGNRITEASTRLVSCPNEELDCELDKAEENACLFKIRCRYIPKCHTVPRCEINGILLSFPGLTEADDWYMTEYCDISLKHGDTVLCYLYTPFMSEDLQTKVVIPVPSSTTTVAPTTDQEHETPATATTEPPLQPRQPEKCNCNECWFALFGAIPIGVAVAVVIWEKCLKKSTNTTADT